jgi:hypothetical protein
MFELWIDPSVKPVLKKFGLKGPSVHVSCSAFGTSSDDGRLNKHEGISIFSSIDTYSLIQPLAYSPLWQGFCTAAVALLPIRFFGRPSRFTSLRSLEQPTNIRVLDTRIPNPRTIYAKSWNPSSTLKARESSM